MVTILILDDTDSTLRTLHAMLTREERLQKTVKTVVLCDDPIEAVTTFSETEPDLLILDYMMPNLTGFEFLNAVKWSASDGPPVILISAFDNSGDLKKKAADYGIQNILSKPIKLQTLTDTVVSVLEASYGT